MKNAVLLLDEVCGQSRKQFIALVDLDDLDHVADVINFEVDVNLNYINDDLMASLAANSISFRIAILNNSGRPYSYYDKSISVTTCDKNINYEKVTAASIKELLESSLGSPFYVIL